jgi:hypothetical protein
VALLVVADWTPDVDVVVTCNSAQQFVSSDSLGLVVGEACADTVVYCTMMTVTSGVPEELPVMDPMQWLRMLRRLLWWRPML